MKRILSFCALLFVVSSAAAEPSWNPAKTWVFAVGVLNFDTPGLATWPDAGRVDAVMIAALEKRGVPPEHIVFIKNADATKANVERKFEDLLRKTAPGETLWFYYAGHGGRDYHSAARPVWFVTYDTKSSWPVSDVFKSIETHFKGDTVILTADCCHSGALAVEAPAHAGHLSYGVLTSATASARSTGNWTFTQCLVDMLSGNPLLDADGDGKITFAETARYCEAEMAFGENQYASSAVTGHFSAGTVMALATGPHHARAGDHVEASDQGKWWKAKILDSKDNTYFVTWYGWDRKWDGWIGADRIRAFAPRTFSAGTGCEVEWDKTWYKGSVLQNKLGLNLVHYDGYPNADDEWVPGDRIRVK